MIDYKFNELKLIEEFKEYVDKTYSSHYGANARNLQSAEVISERGRGMDFFLGNIDKYNDRYGKKGEPADWRKDLVKIIHYGFFALNEHDQRYPQEETITITDVDTKILLTPFTVGEYNSMYNYDDSVYNTVYNTYDIAYESDLDSDGIVTVTISDIDKEDK